MLEPVFSNPWVRAGALLAAILVVGLLVYLLSPVLIPLFFAFLVAYVLDPVVDFFEKRHVRRTITIVAMAAIGLVLIAAFPAYVLPSVIHEADELRAAAEERLAATGEERGGLVNWIADRLPLESLVESLGWAPADAENYDPLAVLTSEVASRIREGATDFLQEHGSDLLTFGQEAGSGVVGVFGALGRWFLGLVLFIGNFALFAFVAGYLLKDFDTITASAKELLPPRFRGRVMTVMWRIDAQLRGFLRGQGLVCVALGVMYAAGLMIAGVPFGLILGIFGGIASFVPYLGLMLTIGPAMVLCVVQHGGFDLNFVIVLATFGIAQFLEGTLITPKVVGENVGLGPVWVILAVLVFGNALGFLGLLLAVPIAATLKVLVEEGIDFYRKSGFFNEKPEKAG